MPKLDISWDGIFHQIIPLEKFIYFFLWFIASSQFFNSLRGKNKSQT